MTSSSVRFLRMNKVTHYAKIVGHVVRSCRKICGIKMDDMASSMKLSKSGWSRVETGDTAMTVPQLRTAASLLGRKTSELVADADRIATRLKDAGVTVHDAKPKDVDGTYLGIFEMMAIVSGGIVPGRGRKGGAS